jgi:hypothetical protein
LCHPHTLSAALACVRQLREAMQLALPADALYWLVHNGTVHIFRLTAPLLTAGYAAEVRATRPSHPLCTGWCTTARSIFSASPHQGPRWLSLTLVWRQVVEFLLFAVVAMESVLLLCSPTYLPWRTQLTATVVQVRAATATPITTCTLFEQ